MKGNSNEVSRLALMGTCYSKAHILWFQNCCNPQSDFQWDSCPYAEDKEGYQVMRVPLNVPIPTESYRL